MESVTKFILHFLLAILYINFYGKCDPHNGGNFASIDNVSSYREENLLDVSHLKGKDIRSIGWIQSSFANEGFHEANLPKRALKEYLNTKDRLFVAYMDLFIGGRSTQENKFPPGMFRVMSDILRRRRKRQLPALTKDGVLISRYALRGNLAAARKDMKRLKKVATEYKDDGSIIIGPYRVRLEEKKTKKPTISIQLTGIKKEPGSIIRKFIYQSRRNPAMYRSGSKGSRPKNRQRQGKVKAMENRLQQLQRRRIRLQRRLKQEKRKLRRKMQKRRRGQQNAEIKNPKLGKTGQKANTEARRRRKEDRMAQKKLKQKLRRIKQKINGQTK